MRPDLARSNPSSADSPASRARGSGISREDTRWAERLGYPVLRACFGLILLTHGLPKALGQAHGSMADPMAGSIHLIQNVMGLPFAPQLALLVVLLETVGALMLATGALTRWVALAVVVEMAGICVALGPTWVWIDRGIEFPVLMLVLAAYMALKGGGRLSIDALFQRRRVTAAG